MSVVPGDEVVARGRRTVVRRKRLEDAADEYRWRSDPELAQYDASRPVQAPFEEYQRNWSFDYRFTDMAGRSFAIEDENGRHIGNVMYYNIDSDRGEAEIGISVGERECWSQGYGSDALAAMVRTLFGWGALRRLYLHTLDWNERAQRGFRKAGFAICGTSWRDGHTFVVMDVWREGMAAAVPARPALA
ncbi:MAG: GNAT family N-acetyltransferase [Chloroflexi bacterium]|nr:GNAT family N-acetyltransferase [Chloroflexota bacterium]